MKKINSRCIYLLASLLFVGILLINNTIVVAVVPYLSERVHLTPTGGIPAGYVAGGTTSVSQDGRYVAFVSDANDIVVGDTNNWPDAFVRDRKLGTTIRASLSSTGAQLLSGTTEAKMSDNGRYVLFTYRNTDATSDPTNGKYQVYIRDLKNNTTELAIVGSTGGLSSSNLSLENVDISADGRYVVFTALAADMTPGSGTLGGVFIRDRKLGTTKLLSKSITTGLASGNVGRPVISCDGSYVAFEGTASDLVPGDTNGFKDIFLVDRINNNLISNITISGNGSSYGQLDVSCNGEVLVFVSIASNLVTGDTNGVNDVFAYSMIDQSIQRVSVDSSGNEITSTQSRTEKSSVDFSGRYVIFRTSAGLVSNDTNGLDDIYLRDLVDGVTQVVTLKNNGAPSTRQSNYQAISRDGRYVIFDNSEDLIGSGGLMPGGSPYIAPTGI